MCIPPVIFPGAPPDTDVFGSRHRRAVDLGAVPQIEYIDPAPSAETLDKMVKAKLSAIELQRQIDEQARRPASGWESLPSFWHALGALVILALISLYVVLT